MKRKQYFLFCLLLLTPFAGIAGAERPSGKTVEGFVFDGSTREGLPGVSVMSGEHQVLTDTAGHYILPGLPGTVCLTFRYVGCLEQQLPVSLSSDTTHVQDIYLHEAIFAPASAQQGVYDNTSAIELTDILSSQQAMDVRGISRSGQWGSGSNLFIQGFNSLNANAQPLIVIDGAVMDFLSGETSIQGGYSINRLLDIDVADIDYVEVIKDGATLYGSKGANGVISIHTRKGVANRTSIALDASLSGKQSPNLPDMLSADEFRTYVSEIAKGSEEGNKMADSFEGIFIEQPSDKTYTTYHNNTSWNDEVYQTGLLQRYALNINGGDEVARYNASVGYLTGNDVVKSTSLKRIHTRVRADVNLAKWFDLGVGVNFSRVERVLRDDGSDAVTSPAFVARIKAPFLSPYKYTDDGKILTNTLSDVDALGISNPVALIQNGKGDHKQYHFSINAQPVFTIARDWKIRGQFTYWQDNTNEHYFSPMTGVTPVEDEEVGIIHNTVREQNIRHTSLYGDVKVEYRHTFAGIHRLEAMLGDRILSNQYKSTFGEGHNTGDDQIYNLSPSLDGLQSTGEDTRWRSNSLYLYANYSLLGRYSVWGMVTGDVSSRFGAEPKGAFKSLGGQWAVFPAAGAKWDIKAEPFMRNVAWMDALSLKISWGKSGNDALDALASKAYLMPVNYVDVAAGNIIGNLRNASLKWEVTTRRMISLETALLHNRLQLRGELFSNVTDDLLTYRQNSIYSGLGAYLTNSGTLSNKGYGVELSGKAVNRKNFKWNLSLSAAHYRNEITSLPEGSYLTQCLDGYILTAVGQPAGVFYGYRTAGVFSTSKEAAEAGLSVRNEDTSLSSFAAGDVHFLEPNAAYADGIIDENDMTVIGDPNPDIIGALASNMQIWRFVLDVHATFSIGGDIYNYQRSQLEGMSTFYNQSRAVLNRWKGEGQVTDMPRSSYDDPLGNSRFSDRWIEDGSYAKIKQIRLSYRLPIDAPFIEGITFWGAVDNVVTFTRYLGSDPEVSCSGSVLSQGIDYGLLPACRTFTFGLRLNL